MGLRNMPSGISGSGAVSNRRVKQIQHIKEKIDAPMICDDPQG